VNPLKELSPAERAALLVAPTLTLPETAQVLGCGLSSLRDALRTGQLQLPQVRVGARVVVPTSSVRRLLGMDEAAATGGPGPVLPATAEA
jgi:hypothetical protein